MELRTLSIKRKAIVFDVVLNPESTDEAAAQEERRVTAHEAPLPELTSAFAKLAPVVCDILELPEDWSEGLNVTKLTISYTKAGTRSVKLRSTKQLNVRRDFLHVIDTPMVQLDKPADGESGEVQVDAKAAKLILKAIHEATRYASGERSQQLLGLDTDKDALNAQFADREPSML